MESARSFLFSILCSLLLVRPKMTSKVRNRRQKVGICQRKLITKDRRPITMLAANADSEVQNERKPSNGYFRDITGAQRSISHDSELSSDHSPRALSAPAFIRYCKRKPVTIGLSRIELKNTWSWLRNDYNTKASPYRSPKRYV